MTPKIARYLADHQPATPCLVLDVDRVEANFRAIRAALRFRHRLKPLFIAIRMPRPRLHKAQQSSAHQVAHQRVLRNFLVQALK